MVNQPRDKPVRFSCQQMLRWGEGSLEIFLGSDCDPSPRSKCWKPVDSQWQTEVEVAPIGFSLHLKRKSTEQREKIIYSVCESSILAWGAYGLVSFCVLFFIFCCYRYQPLFSWDQKSILDHLFTIRSGSWLDTQQIQFVGLSLRSFMAMSMKVNPDLIFNTLALAFNLFLKHGWEKTTLFVGSFMTVNIRRLLSVFV